MAPNEWFFAVELSVFGLAAACTALFYARVKAGEVVSASAHWGGLGGGTGGWRVTTALVTLVAGLFLWALGAALAIYSTRMARVDAAAKLSNERADAATMLKLKREDEKTALDEKHRAEDQAQREAERLRTEKAAADKAATSPSAAVAPVPPKGAAPKPAAAPSAAPAPAQ
ncbi:MAG TPA: hypothetical protein VIK01_22450 [Polyangiaceae bacterium]